MAVKCSKGHWYDPGVGGKGRCPQCATQTQNETSVSDDDVLAIINLPLEVEEAVSPQEQHDHPEGFPKNGLNSAIMRRKKICPDCSHEASFSFDHCPRCGTPLKLASVELRKK